MKNNQVLILTIILSFIVGSTGCVKPATKSPDVVITEPEPTSEISFPLPGTADDVMGQLEAFATQTAMAMSGGISTPESDFLVDATSTLAVETIETKTEQVDNTVTPEPETSEASAEIVVPTATPGLPKTYTLKKGEHPYCIARRYNVNPSELLRLSGLGSGNTYPAGTQLKIPQSGGKFPGDRSLRNHPTTYTVVSGDTIYSIACLFGDVDPEAIIYANNLEAPYNLEPGDKLKIP